MQLTNSVMDLMQYSIIFVLAYQLSKLYHCQRYQIHSESFLYDRLMLTRTSNCASPENRKVDFLKVLNSRLCVYYYLLADKKACILKQCTKQETELINQLIIHLQ